MIVVAALAIVALVVQQILHARERQSLLDRIQAPQQVTALRAPDPSDEMLHVPLEDDEAAADYAIRVRNGEVV